MKPDAETITLLDRLTMESEAFKDLDLPAEVRPARRGNLLAIRLTDNERADLEKLAAAQHLPPSTMARSIVMRAVEKELASA